MENNNIIYYGDNLEIMKSLLEEKSDFIDLVYIDPPFNSKRNYNILYKDRNSEDDEILQQEVFKDTWSNVHYRQNLEEIKNLGLLILDNYLSFIKDSLPPSYVSYLSMMAIRIYYIKELLKDTGSFYLHCDPTMSHYLKTMCDLIFGSDNFRNEIVWKRTYAHNDPRKFGRNQDIILFFTKSSNFILNVQYESYDPEYIKTNFGYNDERGKYQSMTLTGPGVNPNDETWQGYNPSQSNRSWSIPKRVVNRLVGDKKAKTMSRIERLNLLEKNNYIIFSKNKIPRFKEYLHEMPGTPIQEIWTDINPIGSQAKERLGYPTQKPLALLTRIIQASSNEGDLVADFFCGCGTTVDACASLKRNFIGADISTISTGLIRKRLQEKHSLIAGKHYEVEGLPQNLEQAKMLAKQDKFKFQDWAVHYLARGIVNKKKTGDKGIDGYLYFKSPEKEPYLCILEIKGGENLSISQVRAFIKTCQEDEKRAGVLLTMGNITDGMKRECFAAGTVFLDIPKCEIVNIEDVMVGKEPKVFHLNSLYKNSKKETRTLF